jgi:hypothetical protein
MADPDAHQPCPSAFDPPDGEEDHRSKGPTPTIDHAKDHHAARLIVTFPHRASGAGATINRSRPVGLQYVKCSGGLPALLPQPAKAERSGHGTRQPGQAIERRWWKGSGIEEEEEGSGYGLTPKEVTRGQASGGASGGGLDLATVDWVRLSRLIERAER